MRAVTQVGMARPITRVGLTQGGAAPAAPLLLSATILSDGVTLRLAFDQPIVAGSATAGLSRSVGSISSGVIAGGNVDLTIPKVYAGDSVGTISYDANTGTLASASAFVESFAGVAIVNNSTQVPAPSLVSATVLSNGTTLRLVFSAALTSGNATNGFSRSVGSISSGTYSGVNLDLVIPKVYAGDAVGTISYNAATGDLSGAGGEITAFTGTAIVNNAAAWTPAELPGIVDYGVWTSTDKMRQPDGSTPVTAAGQPVGYWTGELGVLTYIQGTTGNAPIYAADCVDFSDAATNKYMDAAVSWNANDAFLLAHAVTDLKANGNGSVLYLLNEETGLFSFNANATTGTVRCVARGGGDVNVTGSPVNTRRNYIKHRLYNQVSPFAATYINGTKYNHSTRGTKTGNTVLRIGAFSTNNTAKSYGWAVVRSTSAEIADETITRLNGWLETL